MFYIKTIIKVFSRLFIEFINHISHVTVLLLIAFTTELSVFASLSLGMLIFQLINTISYWGFDAYSIERLNTQNKNSKTDNKSVFFSSIIYSKLSISFLLLLIFNFISNFEIFFLKNDLLLYVSIAALSSNLVPIWYFQAIGSSEKCIVPTFYSRLIFISICFFFIEDSQSSIKWYFIANTLAITFLSIYLYIQLFRLNVKFIKIKFKDLIKCIFDSYSYFVNVVSNNLFLSIWSLSVIFIGNEIITSAYNISSQILRLGMSLSELAIRVIRQSLINLNVSNLIKFILLLIGIIFVIISIIYLNFEYIINLFERNDFLNAANVLKVFMFVWFINLIHKSLNYLIVPNIINDYERFNTKSIYYFLIHIVFSCLWIIFSNDSLIVLSYLLLISVLVQLLISIIYLIYYNEKKF